MTEHVRNEGVYTIEYLLLQIAKIQDQTDYLTSAMEKLSEMGDGDSGDCGAPGNIQGQAKAQAMGEIVSSRERTNQQLLSLYEKMYEDLRPANGSGKPEALE